MILFDKDCVVFFNHFNIALQLFHFSFHSFLSILFWCGISDNTQSLVLMMKLFPVLF